MARSWWKAVQARCRSCTMTIALITQRMLCPQDEAQDGLMRTTVCITCSSFCVAAGKAVQQAARTALSGPLRCWASKFKLCERSLSTIHDNLQMNTSMPCHVISGTLSDDLVQLQGLHWLVHSLPHRQQAQQQQQQYKDAVHASF